MSVIKRVSVCDLILSPESFSAGDKILLSGKVYTARDAAHKKLIEILNKGEKPPIELQNAAIYYAGPTEARPPMPSGSMGPTTSSRMDPFAPTLMEHGVKLMIGKGERSEEVRQAIIKHKGLYLLAVGGAGAIAAKCIESLKIVAFSELGTESIKEITLKDFPLFVGIDSNGNKI